MKKINSHISVAIVCAILGFMLSYQIKVLIKQDKTLNMQVNKNNSDITVEIEQYKKQKEQLEKKVDELQKQVKEYENSAAGKSDEAKNLYNELENTRLLTGNTDVHGPGVVIYLDPESAIFSSNASETITDRHLVYLVNELKFAGAEAISINDTRITARTGIRNAGNYILINDDRVSPSRRITIKAIGDKNLLYGALGFPEVFTDFKRICDIKYEKMDDVKIGRYNKTYKFNYTKPSK
ncbi:hypothetical protein CLOACE_01570 [Clostridium acetireducens DSM 10703]|jgi:uncharacterized protein YlxW (UPF0749 family)|uniref:Division initiation protein n=1 Tax=Clostridium acetireducens DSM 10703 TaxID=1121290 RepID=A0A1E8F1N1_9CLOT|nr:DUF881 domain-containing protein [Clostridium acetireducens]OFI07553.1 hypothetical protein CLOACE_01570 [Clostridium acetireducens DSM 10703]